MHLCSGTLSMAKEFLKVSNCHRFTGFEMDTGFAKLSETYLVETNSRQLLNKQHELTADEKL